MRLHRRDTFAAALTSCSRGRRARSGCHAWCELAPTHSSHEQSLLQCHIRSESATLSIDLDRRALPKKPLIQLRLRVFESRHGKSWVVTTSRFIQTRITIL